MQSVSSTSSWCGNLHQAQQVAAQGLQWAFGCLPCVKGQHRVHPTNLESSNVLYVVIDAKKRLRILHILPDSDSNLPKVQTNSTDQVDLADHCSLDSSGGDYWFMRWNRPIRPNFQRNLCNCSFRRSQSRSKSDLKESKLENNNDSNVLSTLEETTNLQNSVENTSTEKSLCDLAEKISQDILDEAVQKISEIKSSSSSPSMSSKAFEQKEVNDSSNHCDNVDVQDVELTVQESQSDFGGYVNPVFIASNDALDLIPSDETPKEPCDTQTVTEDNKVIATNPEAFLKDHQDYNANDHKQQAFEKSDDKPNQNVMSLKGESRDRNKHRKSCLASFKAQVKKPLLLLIHGAGSNCEVWQNLISHLVQGGYECLAPDLLGHGLSSAPDHAKSYTFHSYLQDLLFIFDRFVAEGRTAVILGHGYGCSLAAAIARYRPEQVIQLVLISGGGPTPLAPRIPPSVSPCLRACLEPLLMCGFKRDVVYSVCGKQIEPISPEESGVPRHIVGHISQGHVWPEGDAAFHRRIVAPTLLVHGMKDQHITLVQECEMERTIPRSFLEVIPEAGHWAMLETPTHLSHMILCFIDWWAPPNRTQ
ncbi:uncharacterized protein LOC117645037 [Thrips palmi]|uniref:acylglycerol lipase n=1 Tax=Thrips palmi TaxID=161013 RepID=A0A6P8YLM7_THRPL|nr:uncharacterized protein LOC117645037 [Thrips palmi]XP_034240814.1 uncharacterized protein LOC117645037 [Thrips palmi]XP_034240816.1 uncharacterized protein LOC117645037 [Thrips palmi]